MSRYIPEEGREDLLERGYSRRQLGRIAAVFGVGALAATAGRPAWAERADDVPQLGSSARVRIGANEWWTGPLAPGQAAAAAIIGSSNRYLPHDERRDFIRTAAVINNVPEDHIAPFPGSSDPLARAVVTFCSPTRALVTADPTFELAWEAATWLGAPVRRVPLKADFSHDVRAMVQADPNAGLYYVCSPNNPTGTVTPLADIEWLVANKPGGALVLVDEAYIHFSGDPSAAALVAAGKDVIVLRTFSKIFGMAGMRMGYMMARPDLIHQMMRYDGGMASGALPMPSLACATASLPAFDLLAARRRQMEDARAMAVEHVRRRGFTVLPTRANMFMVDWKSKPGREVQAAFRAQGVDIGRAWAVWPTMSRITVGSMDEMNSFCAALDRVWA